MWIKILSLVAGKKLVNNWYVGKAIEEIEQLFADGNYDGALAVIDGIDNKYKWPSVRFWKAKIFAKKQDTGAMNEQLDLLEKDSKFHNSDIEVISACLSDNCKLQINNEVRLWRLLEVWKPIVLSYVFSITGKVLSVLILGTLISSIQQIIEKGNISPNELHMKMLLLRTTGSLFDAFFSMVFFIVLIRVILLKHYKKSVVGSLYSDYILEKRGFVVTMNFRNCAKKLFAIATLAVVGNVYMKYIFGSKSIFSFWVVWPNYNSIYRIINTFTLYFAQIAVICFLMITIIVPILSSGRENSKVHRRWRFILCVLVGIATICLLPRIYINQIFPVTILAFLLYCFYFWLTNKRAILPIMITHYLIIILATLLFIFTE
ncbi:MAG: hypothetical protein WCP79_05820 [Bacillota bacterium]